MIDTAQLLPMAYMQHMLLPDMQQHSDVKHDST
jgi:hypothetical protein